MLTVTQINGQLGLNNLKKVENYASFIAKSDLPYSSFANMSTELREKPVLTYADSKSLWFAGMCESGCSKTNGSEPPN